MAFGPTLGSLLIRSTGKTISVFYLTALVHSIYAVLIFFGLPEPLSKRRREESKRKYEEELRAGAEERRSTSGFPAVVAKTKRLFKFLSPLSIFTPDFVNNSRNPLKWKEMDWNLSLIAVAYGFTISIMVSFACDIAAWSIFTQAPTCRPPSLTSSSSRTQHSNGLLKP